MLLGFLWADGKRRGNEAFCSLLYGLQMVIHNMVSIWLFGFGFGLVVIVVSRGAEASEDTHLASKDLGRRSTNQTHQQQQH